jgi:hypothetical protein
MLTMAEQWREILAHFASLRDATQPRLTPRRPAQHKPSPIIKTYADAAMKRRQCHKG